MPKDHARTPVELAHQVRLALTVEEVENLMVVLDEGGADDFRDALCTEFTECYPLQARRYFSEPWDDSLPVQIKPQGETRVKPKISRGFNSD